MEYPLKAGLVFPRDGIQFFLVLLAHNKPFILYLVVFKINLHFLELHSQFLELGFQFPRGSFPLEGIPSFSFLVDLVHIPVHHAMIHASFYYYRVFICATTYTQILFH